MILRVGVTLVLATLLALAAVTGAQAKGKKPVKAAKLAVSMPAATTAGEAFAIRLTAVSRQGKPVRSFRGSVAPSVNQPDALLPSEVKLSRGKATIPSAELHRSGAATVSFSGSLRGAASTEVEPGGLAELEVSAPDGITVNKPFVPSLRGIDEFGNPTSLPAAATYSLTPDGSCDDTGACRVTRSGAHTLIADVASHRAAVDFDASGGQVASLSVSAPASAVAGETFRPVVVARDADGDELPEASERAELGVANGWCSGVACSSTKAGAQRVTATVGGVLAETSIRIDHASLASLTLSSSGAIIRPVQPTGTAAAYSSHGLADTAKFTVAGADRFGNGLGDLTNQAAVSFDGNPCPDGVCSGTTPGKRKVTATIGSVSAQADLEVGGYEYSYGMTCDGQNYDVDASMLNGCEVGHPDPGHTTEATALDLGRKSCSDSASRMRVESQIITDRRQHPGLGGHGRDSGATSYRWKVFSTGGLCQNDYDFTLTTSGGADDGRECYEFFAQDGWGKRETIRTDGNGSVRLQSPSGSYQDNTDVRFGVSKVCNDGPNEVVNFTVDGHL